MSRSNRDQAVDKLEELKDMISAEKLLDYVISNYLSGSEALNAMICAEEEFFPKEEDEDEDLYEVCTFDSEKAVSEVYEGGLSYQRALVAAMQLFDSGKFFGVQVVSNLPEDDLDPIVWIKTK